MKQAKADHAHGDRGAAQKDDDKADGEVPHGNKKDDKSGCRMRS